MKLKIVLTVTVMSLFICGATAGFTGAFTHLTAGRFTLYTIEFITLEGTTLYGIFERRAPVFGRIFWRGSQNLHAIALTFDDGPNEPYTSGVLDILREFRVNATFFVIGENVERFPGVVRRTAAEGHELANHTYDHEVLPLRWPGPIRNQIKRTSDLIEKTTGRRPGLFRAPHGWRNPWVNRIAREEGCVPVAWTVGVWDTDRPGAEVIVQRTLKGLGNGCVLLLHDSRGTERGADASQLVTALPAILQEAQRQGYRFLTLSEMVGETNKK